MAGGAVGAGAACGGGGTTSKCGAGAAFGIIVAIGAGAVAALPTVPKVGAIGCGGRATGWNGIGRAPACGDGARVAPAGGTMPAGSGASGYGGMNAANASISATRVQRVSDSHQAQSVNCSRPWRKRMATTSGLNGPNVSP
jgi:hypothetical protein